MTDRTCAVDGCGRPARSRGWCQTHYFRWRRNGDPGSAAIQTRGVPRPCSVDGCDSERDAQGLCSKHYQRLQKWGDPNVVGEPARGDAHPQWKHNNIGYGTAHERVRGYRGPASGYLCCECGAQARQWAYDHADADERASDLGPYSVNPAHYRPMCVPCHKRFDLALVG